MYAALYDQLVVRRESKAVSEQENERVCESSNHNPYVVTVTF